MSDEPEELAQSIGGVNAQLAYALAATTPRRIAYATQLAQSYAGEIPAPRLRRVGAKPDPHEPPSAPDS